jgi:hypothetical protein
MSGHEDGDTGLCPLAIAEALASEEFIQGSLKAKRS